MSDERLARYGSAIWTTSRADEGTISATGANIVARAVMAVADAEIEQVRRERDKAIRIANASLDYIDEFADLVALTNGTRRDVHRIVRTTRSLLRGES